jgi:HD superfamily phosphohydrolase
VSGFEKSPLALARQIVRLAALLHDVGHASFSHAAEKVIFPDHGHEGLSAIILKDAEFLGRDLHDLFGEECQAYVWRLIGGSPDLPPQLKILHDLVSGELDADRTDYLLRDSLHCGVEYGRFDHERMIESLDLCQGNMGELQVALDREGIHTFEALILARYQMNTQVYFHRLRRLFDLYLIKYHQSLGADLPKTPTEILAHTDVSMMAKIFEDARTGAGDRRKWAERISQRRHHRIVHDTGFNASAMDLRRSKEIHAILAARYGDKDLLWDLASGAIHKLLVPEDQDEKDWVTFPLIGGDGVVRQVGEESQVLRRVPRRFQAARVFADIAPEDEKSRNEIRDDAAKEWRERGGR